MSNDEVKNLFLGYGYEPFFVEGHEPAAMHRLMSEVLETALGRIRHIQRAAREGPATDQRPQSPLIVLRSPKGWTDCNEVDGLKVEGAPANLEGLM